MMRLGDMADLQATIDLLDGVLSKAAQALLDIPQQEMYSPCLALLERNGNYHGGKVQALGFFPTPSQAGAFILGINGGNSTGATYWLFYRKNGKPVLERKRLKGDPE